MGLVLPRQKQPTLLVRLLYLLRRLPFASPRRRLRLFLDLEWIFNRFSQEESFNIYEGEDHPTVTNTQDFLAPLLQHDFTVLDVGCNVGIHTDYIARYVKETTGIDIDISLIEEARRRWSRDNLLFEVADCSSFLSTRSDCYDLIFLSHILEHLDTPEDFLLQVKGRTKYLYIEVPDFERCITNRHRQEVDTPLIYSDVDHRYEFDRNEIAALLTGCGFRIQEHEYRYGVMRFWCSA